MAIKYFCSRFNLLRQSYKACVLGDVASLPRTLFLHVYLCFEASSLLPMAPMVFVNILKFSQEDFQSDRRCLKPVKNLQCSQNIGRSWRPNFKQFVHRVWHRRLQIASPRMLNVGVGYNVNKNKDGVYFFSFVYGLSSVTRMICGDVPRRVLTRVADTLTPM